MPRQCWTGFYLIWAVALAICAALILAPAPPVPFHQPRLATADHFVRLGQRPAASPRAATFTPGEVWVNTRSHVYHYPGQRWYGRTQDGKYMREAVAIAEGDRATRNGQ